MALDVTRQVIVNIPVGVSTELSPLNTDRISFIAQCRGIGTTWHVTLEVLAAAPGIGFAFSGRQSFNIAESVAAQGNATDHFEGAINVFVVAAAGVTSVDFWVVETEVVP